MGPAPASSPKRILVIEDSPVYRHLITSYLREWGFDAVMAETGEEGWRILERSDSPRLVLMDWVMPGMDGVHICKKLRERKESDSYVYSIVLTSKDTHKDLLYAMEAGADDYLVKPFDELELKARLQVGMRIVGLQEELIAARERMRHAATYDSLTGLTNRREVIDFLGREIARSRREKKEISVVMADVDHFKSVNDRLGHKAGDEVLKEVARRLKSKLRVYDGLGRYGGEEFLLVLPGCNLTGALIRADDLRATISGTPIVAADTRLTVTLSMGVAVKNGESAIELEAFLAEADRALYKAKAGGRNQVQSGCDAEMAMR